MTESTSLGQVETCTQKRRHAAGADPEKRRQILEGAWRVFVDQGFDAASMNSICKAAGVSKGTLYVYFENKEDLFVALVEDKRGALFQGIEEQLAVAGSVEERLLAYARGLGMQLSSEDVIRAQRIVISVVDRMPELGVRFYDAGARQFLTRLQEFLRQETEAGNLAVTDPELAASQFVDLSTTGSWRARLFGRRSDVPSEAELLRVASEAVRVFMAAYKA
ncbi:TetR/AcrR family transcriptional regulator [Salipiger sp. P9]|uniref:TetR/AcrR family transcriptional regulator n=1 Tax=Salipiger pentaromativorans TaxID=2943193 RepID=UPI0021574A41|nr:TetR/AcrR family transcriptional regulator [Salipiger pentaromativorans]MCR8550647.1 TetR/AcrR family transcriptional regulator [Salipiger pentaromativorans]